MISIIGFRSTLMRDEGADLIRRCEDHVGAISHHSGTHEGRRPLLRTIVADIGLEAQIALPEIANLAVGGRNLVSIPATSAAHLIAALRGLGRMAIERDLTAAAWDRR
jgi:hypothetical protein